MSSAAAAGVDTTVPTDEQIADLFMPTGNAAAVRREDPDENRFYTYPPNGREFLSVTTVLGATCNKAYLMDWAAKLAAEWAAANLQVLLTLDGGGTSRAAVVGAIKNQARALREIKREAGVAAHDVIEALALWSAAGAGADIVLPDIPDELYLADMDGIALAEFVEEITTGFINFVSDFDVVIEMSEAAAYNAMFEYAGTVDLVAFLGGHRKRLMIDCKTGKHLDSTMREQLAAYRRATEVLVDDMGTLAPMPEVDGVAVLHLRPRHEKGFERGYRLMVVSEDDDRAAWETFRYALNTYQGRYRQPKKPGRVLLPLGSDGLPQPPRLCDLDGEGYGAGLAKLIEAGYITLADVAAMTREQCLGIRGIGPKSAEAIERALAAHGYTFASHAAEVA